MPGEGHTCVQCAVTCEYEAMPELVTGPPDVGPPGHQALWGPAQVQGHPQPALEVGQGQPGQRPAAPGHGRPVPEGQHRVQGDAEEERDGQAAGPEEEGHRAGPGRRRGGR
jgi:hypothetical protein